MAAIQMLAPAFQICAHATAETAIVDATEMSISPATTTNVRPKASRPMKMYGETRSSRFARLRKKLESVQLQIPAPTMSTTSSASQRATALRRTRATALTLRPSPRGRRAARPAAGGGGAPGAAA